LNDHRDFALSVGPFQHGVHILLTLFHINVFMCFVSRPGPIGIRSAGLSVDDYFFVHFGSSHFDCGQLYILR
jgi:hypothetical protein